MVKYRKFSGSCGNVVLYGFRDEVNKRVTWGPFIERIKTPVRKELELQ